MRAKLARRRIALAAALLTTACTAGEEQGSDPQGDLTASGSPTAVPSPAQEERSLGEPASVTLTNRDGESSEVEVSVTEVTEGRIGHLRQFRLDEQARSSTPYYATVRVRNTGDADLGGRRVQLWGLDSQGVVRPPADVVGAFRRCQNDPLPRRFGQGDTASTCLLYLVPEGATLEAVQYRFNNRPPFSWPAEG
jgi:hypothetical protein